MTPKDFIRKVLISTCVICTLISVFFYFLAAIVNEVESLFDETAVTFRQFLLILLHLALHPLRLLEHVRVSAGHAAARKASSFCHDQ